jgi:hypothetical protein
VPSISNDNASSLPNGINASTAEPINTNPVPETAR